MPHIHALYDFVVTIYIVHKNKVLLSCHPRYEKWLPVGGHIELSEHPEQALRREILEETGLTAVKILADKPKLKSAENEFIYSPNIVEVHEANPPHKHIALVYFAVAPSNKFILSKEHEELRWFSLSELKDNKYNLSETVQYCCRKAIETALQSQ